MDLMIWELNEEKTLPSAIFCQDSFLGALILKGLQPSLPDR